jgi:serine/threonine protein kinase
MTPDELSKIREIYEKALVMSDSSREAFLAQECQGKPEIREEVERLLKARGNVPAWLDQPVAGLVRPFVAPTLPKMEGRRLSSYTLIREIGRGGMGSVYLAERSDGAFQKRVAIKLVLPSLNAAGAARFQQERAILASLDHPNIARLLDGGVTEEGRPYFVMEFVEGQPIDRWCDERRLNVGQRIELFRSVISAVRYAHQRLVVHRDLKPGNIFVTHDGTVKLLDFGIAKVLSTKDAGEAPETVTLAQMMTPQYASPEQVNGSAITTLSDVYSLGVILYELLTGHRPYRLLSAAMHEMARVIAEEDPIRPSDVVTTTESAPESGGGPITPVAVSAVREGDPIRLRKRLAGDLDSILLMALRKEPERRYSSAESFADDLQRHLDHRPVTAREASPWDRAKRFCRRNPGGVAAGVLVVMSLLAGGATLIWQARHMLQTAPPDSAQVFLVPVWAYFTAFAALALGAALYFWRPSRPKLLAIAAGGVAWGIAIGGKWWLEHYLGWWRSRFRDTPDPLMVLSPWTWLTYPVFGMLFLLLLSAIGRRFGWKGQAIALVAFGLYQEPREHAYFSTFLPALSYQPGLTPILGGAAMLITGGVVGLLVMRLIAGPDRPSRERAS